MGQGGSEVVRFAEELKAFFQVESCFLLSSGKAALTVTLLALKKLHPERDQVLIPAYTCFSVPSAVVRAGLKVVLCDVDPETLDYDFEKLQGKLNSDRLLCVVANHLFGLPADVDRLRQLISDPDITILEDAAQALGGQKDGTKLGTTGDVGIFSLGRGKAFSTVEGGIIVTKRADIAAQIDDIYARQPDYSTFECVALFFYAIALKCLIMPSFFWIPKSLPFLRMGETIYDPDFKIRRLSPLQAGFSSGWERSIESLWRDRGCNTRRWYELLDDGGQLHYCHRKTCPDLIRYPWRVVSEPQRTDLLTRSDADGLGIALTYPGTVATIAELRDQFVAVSYPGAAKCAEQLVTLPVHSLLSSSDIARIRHLILDSRDNVGVK